MKYKIRCDRCGKFAEFLCVLPHEWKPPIADQGSFCLDCIETHTPADWLTWLRDKGYFDAKL